MMNRLDIRLKVHRFDDDIDYLVVEIKIDGQPLADFDYYASDLQALMDSVENSGEFFILTCWCGVPECAGIRQGIRVCHEGEVTYWQVHQPEPRGSFVFERLVYEQAIGQVIKQGNRLIDYLTSDDNRPIEITPRVNKRFFKRTSEDE